MSALWTASEIAAATGGMMSEPFEATGISIDSRTTQPGDLFVALIDARDGHDYIDAAIRAGAAGVLCSKPTDAPHVIVADTFQALEALGQAGRNRCAAKRVAVTGSVGKTSVKDALAVMLEGFGRVHRSQRSFNNHLGVPITLATMPRDTDFAVFETGMNHAGELTELSRQVAPHVALITNVGGAHAGNFESIEAIADAKAEIAAGLVEGGTLILNAENHYTPRIIETLGLEPMYGGVSFFGRSASVAIPDMDPDLSTRSSSPIQSPVEYQIHSEESGPTGGRLVIKNRSQFVEVSHSLVGAHWGLNIAACLAVAHTLGIDIAQAGLALAQVNESEGRGDTHKITLTGKTVTLVDQSYNANPESMHAAISAAALLPGRKVALLGDMYELGKDELDLHASLAIPLEASGFARVITLGECMRALRGALPAPMRGPHVDAETVRGALAAELEDGDVLLIKGSNATGLSRLAKSLKAGEG